MNTQLTTSTSQFSQLTTLASSKQPIKRRPACPLLRVTASTTLVFSERSKICHTWKSVLPRNGWKPWFSVRPLFGKPCFSLLIGPGHIYRLPSLPRSTLPREDFLPVVARLWNLELHWSLFLNFFQKHTCITSLKPFSCPKTVTSLFWLHVSNTLLMHW